MMPDIPHEGWASIAGVVLGVWSMTYFDVFGHWNHKWELLADRGSMPNFGNFYECKTCGKRKVERRSGIVTEREQRWIDYQWTASWEPWKAGPPPSGPNSGPADAAAGIDAMRDALPPLFKDAVTSEEVNQNFEDVEQLVGDHGVIARVVMPDGSDFDHDGDGVIEVDPLPAAEPEKHWR